MPPESENPNPEPSPYETPPPDTQLVAPELATKAEPALPNCETTAGSPACRAEVQNEGGTPGTPTAEPAWSHRRNGKIARLPKTVRDQINQMLLDGVPYAKIIEDIGEPGKGLDEDNMRRWKAGGFEDWLLEVQRAEDVGATRDAALSLVNQKAGATVQDAGRTIVSAQLYELLLSFDPRSFADALVEKPELYFRLVNALSRLSEGEALCSRRRAQGSLIADQFSAVQNADGAVVIPADKLNQLIRLIKLL